MVQEAFKANFKYFMCFHEDIRMDDENNHSGDSKRGNWNKREIKI